ncbi:hypothetical protein MMPV_008624 [Pyropia vietnamensis]
MDQLVEVKPTELRFTVAPGVQSTVTLRLRSLVSDALLFKFKTTAPLRYAVQPNASVILPGATVHITVVLKLFNALPPEMTTWRDKFMLQIALVSPQSAANLSTEQVLERWRFMLPDQIVRKKFPCRLGLAPISPISEGDEEEVMAGTRGAASGPTSRHFATPRAGQDDLAAGGAAATLGAVAGVTAAAASDSDADVVVTEEEVEEEEEEIVDDGPSSVARFAPAPAPSLPATPATLIGVRASRERAWENVAAGSPAYQAAVGGVTTPGSSRPPPSATAFPDAPTFPTLSTFSPADSVTPVMPPPLSSGDLPTPAAAEASVEGDEPAVGAPPETAAAKLFVAISSTILATVYRAQEMLAKRKDAAAAAAKAKKVADAAAATPIPPPQDALSPTPVAPSAPSQGVAAAPPPAPSSSSTTAADGAPSSALPGGSAGPLRKGGSFLRPPPPSSIPPLLVSPAPAPVPREALHRAAVARASSAAAALRETEATITALRADLEAAKHRKADAADAVRPLYAARFAVATDAPAPFVDVALMLIITAGLVKLTFLPTSP